MAKVGRPAKEYTDQELQAVVDRRNALRREQYQLDGGKRKAENQAWKEAHREQVREAGRLYQRTRYAIDPAYVTRSRQSSKEWREQNPERVKERYKEWAKRNPGYHTEWNRRNRLKNPKLYLWRSVRNRAKQDGILFDLKVEDIEVPEFCPVLGMKMNVGGSGFADNTASIDRVIPELGYVKHNIRVISIRANAIKRNATPDELRKVADYAEREVRVVQGVK